MARASPAERPFRRARTLPDMVQCIALRSPPPPPATGCRRRREPPSARSRPCAIVAARSGDGSAAMMKNASGEARTVDPEERRIKIHPAAAFEAMRRAGRLAAEVLDFITPHVLPGVTTDALDRLCHGFIVDHGAIPAPLNYRGFPRSICTSINHVVCHGDTSRMFLVGERVPLKARRLVDVTYEAMMRGIAAVRPGVRIGAIGHAIQSFAEAQRFSVVRDFCDHGIGRIFHDAPSILHFGEPEDGPA